MFLQTFDFNFEQNVDIFLKEILFYSYHFEKGCVVINMFLVFVRKLINCYEPNSSASGFSRFNNSLTS